MATLMEKDVLIEMIAFTGSELARANHSEPYKLTDDEIALVHLRNKLSLSDHQEIDFESTKTAIRGYGVCFA